MTKIAILGIDIVGLCIALSLKKNHRSEFQITAAGAEPEKLKFAKNIGAVDNTENSARKCVSDAEIVILDAPLHYIKDLLENLNEIDIEDSEKIISIEKATNNGNYLEKDLLNLYT